MEGGEQPNRLGLLSASSGMLGEPTRRDKVHPDEGTLREVSLLSQRAFIHGTAAAHSTLYRRSLSPSFRIWWPTCGSAQFKPPWCLERSAQWLPNRAGGTCLKPPSSLGRSTAEPEPPAYHCPQPEFQGQVWRIRTKPRVVFSRCPTPRCYAPPLP